MIGKILVPLLFASQLAVADKGPYYISFENHCDMYKLYIQSRTNIVYGNEIGCKEKGTKSIRVSGYLKHKPKNNLVSVHLKYWYKKIKYTDIIRIKKGWSSFFRDDYEFIVNDKFKITKSKPEIK